MISVLIADDQTLASGFLLKDVPPERLGVGLRAVAGGDALLAPAMTRRVIAELVAVCRMPTISW
jgi:DNA-binding NarL/FixJ family response regulator